jgi:3-oxoacyl-[acyl-carrier-protein] synthase II
MKARVVITGLGPLSALGAGTEEFWDSIMNGRSSLKPIESFDASGYKPKLAGEVRDVKIRDFVPKSYRKATKVMARDTELAVIAAKLAAQDAGLITRGSDESETNNKDLFTIDPSRTGCQIGAGLIAADTEELARAVVSAKDDDEVFSMSNWGTENDGMSGMNNLPPLWLLKYLPNMLACHVTIIHGLEGPSNTIMGAEASAILSIGESTRVIERGSADMCFSGGAESRINPLGLLRWDYSGRLADTKDATDSSTITKPYDPDSKGGIIGESGGMLVLENEEHAIQRNAKIYATIAGFGAAQTPPPIFPGIFEDPDSDPLDRGLEAAIESAMSDARVTRDDIDLIIPAALGVPNLDAMELGALRSIFKSQLDSIPMLTLANLLGNTAAGHGGLMAAAGALALYNEEIPPQSNKNGSNNADTLPDMVKSIQYVLVCSGSLGGQTGALILKKYNSENQ